jgi:hypothetical protein
MEWDGQNAARDKGEWLLELIDEAAALAAPHSFVPARELRDSEGAVVVTVTGLRDAVAQLKAIGKPFLNWSGKAERTSFDVPSLPLFIHERLSTKAILETLKGHTLNRYKRSGTPSVGSTSANRACPPQPIASRLLRAATEYISRENPPAIRLKEYGALFLRT